MRTVARARGVMKWHQSRERARKKKAVSRRGGRDDRIRTSDYVLSSIIQTIEFSICSHFEWQNIVRCCFLLLFKWCWIIYKIYIVRSSTVHFDFIIAGIRSIDARKCPRSNTSDHMGMLILIAFTIQLIQNVIVVYSQSNIGWVQWY